LNRFKENQVNAKKRKTCLEKIIRIEASFKTAKRTRYQWVIDHLLLPPLLLSLGLAISLSLLWISAGSAQGRPGYIGLVRTMESEKTGLQYPNGLTFSPKTGAFYAVDGSASGTSLSAMTEIIELSTFGDRAGVTQVRAHIWNPINIAFDDYYGRLLLLQFPKAQLLEIREGSDGHLDPRTLITYGADSFGLQDPQGMALDPASGSLFILDAVGPRILRVEPGLDGRFDGAAISEVDLASSSLTDLHGLAFDPTTGHFYVISLSEQKLYELNQAGQILANHDLTEFKLDASQGMVFAPSGDQTDDAHQTSLYLAEGGSAQILEFTLTDPLSDAIEANQAASTLVRTVNLAAILPPSPDPSGLTYLPWSNTLLISDCEVDEKVSGITHFAGANLWELTLGGGLVRTANISPAAPTVVPMSDEPTGVAWNPLNGHFYFSDDNAYKVFDLNPGLDGQYGTSDDSWTSFGTQAYGIGDPEGITFDTWHNQLFVVDGTNREIYQFTLAGSLVAHFDVAVYGVTDPESVEFNPDSGTLFILSSSSNRAIIETTTSGALLQTISVSASNAKAPAGLAYAPASDGSGVRHFYIVDRGVDNNNDPNIVDGIMYEMSIPSSGQPTATNTTTRTPTHTPTSIMSNTPSRTPTHTLTPSVSNTPTRTPTGTITPGVSNSPTMTPTLTRTPTATATLVSTGFPVTGVVDPFNRTDGAIGSNWSGDRSSFTIASNQMAAISGGMIFWNAASFGAEQEAYVTFVNIDAAATNMELLLKSQTTNKESFLEVGYNPVKKTVQVESYTRAQGYVTYGAAIPVTFSNGDQLGARVTANGTVNIYKNGVLLGVRDVNAWTFYASGGYIGLLSWGGTNTIYDNFGGGTVASVTPTYTVTSAASPSFTPTGTNTPTSTATHTFTPAVVSSPTKTPTTTSTPTGTPTPTAISWNTGFLSPAMNAAQTGGDGNGYEVNAVNAYANDSLFAVDNNSGTGTSSSCTSTGKDKHRFSNYNVTIPGGATVKGIQVQLDAKADSTSGSPKLCVQLSWDGGTTWTAARSTATLTTTEATYLLGGAADIWGHAWTADELDNATFLVRVIDVATSTSRDFSLDWLAVQVTYQ
jgi:hypothetical protein